MGRTGILTKIVMEFTQEDGSVLRRILNSSQAQKWDALVAGVCTFAHIHQANPDWASIKWEEEIIPTPKNKKNKKK